MPTHGPIKVQELKWAFAKNQYFNSGNFIGIQVVLSNGLKSQVFTKNLLKEENLFRVPISANIKKISGTKNTDSIRQITFLGEGDQELSIMTSQKTEKFGPDQSLREGE
jgi:hypothetical protein